MTVIFLLVFLAYLFFILFHKTDNSTLFNSEGTNLSIPEKRKAKAANYYKNKLFPRVRQYEIKRLLILKKLRRNALILIIVTLVFLFYILSSQNPSFMITITIIIGIAIYFLIYEPPKDFTNQIKSTLYPTLFQYFGDDFRFYSNYGSIDRFIASELVPDHNQCIYEDNISGTYHGVSIYAIEVKLTNDKEAYNVESYYSNLLASLIRRDSSLLLKLPCFSGIFIELTLQKHFNCKAILIPNKNIISNKIPTTLERIRLEDPVFRKNFILYGNDQIKARILMNPIFIEKANLLAKRFRSNIHCTFLGNKVYIKLPNADFFEPSGIYERKTLEKDFSLIEKQMNELFLMIDILNLTVDQPKHS